MNAGSRLGGGQLPPARGLSGACPVLLEPCRNGLEDTKARSYADNVSHQDRGPAGEPDFYPSLDDWMGVPGHANLLSDEAIDGEPACLMNAAPQDLIAVTTRWNTGDFFHFCKPSDARASHPRKPTRNNRVSVCQRQPTFQVSISGVWQRLSRQTRRGETYRRRSRGPDHA